jgi:thiol-disulfide isomerase/thioredoxin
MKRLFGITTGTVVILLLTIYAFNYTLTPDTTSIADVPAETSNVQAQPTVEYRSFTVADIAQTGRPQFLNAYATWCPYCQQNDPIIFELQSQFRGRVDFIHLNVDGAGVLDAAAPYTITGVTQYVLIDAEGTIIQKWFGTITEDAISEAITAYLDSMSL